jgi:hypothetical protein
MQAVTIHAAARSIMLASIAFRYCRLRSGVATRPMPRRSLSGQPRRVYAFATEPAATMRSGIKKTTAEGGSP